ncbi:ftsH [Symbiodinium sp. KB8]|nr:ftsH [Symbiodinium sp. KB8]
MTASLTGSLPKLEDLSVTSGLDKQVIVFLRDKGSSSSGVLYHMFANRAKIVKTLEPLKLGADELKLEEVAPDVAAAVLEHMVDEIEVARSSHMSAATTPPSSQTPAVKEYESAQLVYENETSRLFSPVKLGEIISARNFTPSRQVNPWAKSDDKFSELLSLDASGSLVRKDTRVPEPQKALTMMFDAFEAIRWATVFARWGEEFVIGHRSRAVDTPVVAILSESLQLKVATQCRSGKFSEQVESGSVRIPCLTTPSPTAEGRPPPPKRKRDESPETLSRWRKDNKQFAPWQYRAYALVEEKGKLGPPSSPGREFLHDFPEGFGYANATSGRTATSKAFIFRCVRREFDFSGAYDWLQRLPELPEGSLFTTLVKFAEGLSTQSVAEQYDNSGAVPDQPSFATITFADEDPAGNFASGTVRWTLAATIDFGHITHYAVYLAEAGLNKVAFGDPVTWDVTEVVVGTGTMLEAYEQKDRWEAGVQLEILAVVLRLSGNIEYTPHQSEMYYMLRLTARVTLAHEDSLNMTRADRGFVVFLLTGEGSLLTQLLTTSKQWNADQGMVNGKYLPLRHVLIRSLFTELNQRFAAVMNDANRIAEANQKGLLKEGCWPRFRWNSEQHKMEIDDLRTPISMQDTKTLILEVLQDLEDMTTVLKFNAKPGLTDQPRNGRVVLMLEISHFAPRLHQNVLKLCGHGVLTLIAAQIKPETLQRSPMAQELQRLVYPAKGQGKGKGNNPSGRRATHRR